MSSYHRPWWLIVNRPAGLTTTVREETNRGERVFIIQGRPLVQGLVWLTWGPAAALAAVVLLAGLLVAVNIREQSMLLRGLVIAAFLALPALAWGLATLILTRLSQPHLQSERQAGARACTIRLNQEQGEISFSTTALPRPKKLAFHEIRQVSLTQPIGSRNSHTLRLTLETTAGPIILLDEQLGTQAQKMDLANQIQQALKAYAGSPPSPPSAGAPT